MYRTNNMKQYRAAQFRGTKKTSERNQDLQFTGFSQVTFKGNSKKTRMLWAFICSVVIIGSTYQCCERIHYFLTSMPVMNTKLVYRQTIPLPVIIICPCDINYRNPSVDLSLLHNLYGNMTYSNVYDLMDKTEMDIKTLWNISRLVFKSARFILSRGLTLAAGFQEKNDILEVSEIFTTSGTCILLRTKKDVRHQGVHTSIGLLAFGGKTVNKYFQIFYTTEDKVPMVKYFYPMPAILAPLKSVTSVMLRMEEVHLLNTWRLPCEDGKMITKCLTECMQNIIFSKVKNPCRLPFMEALSKIPECSTSQDFRAVFNATDQVVQEFSQEQCKSCNLRRCKEIVYQLESLSKLTDNRYFINVWVKLPENKFPFTQEENIYSLIALFSDISGGLGFFLGVCALQIIEFLITLSNSALAKIQGNQY